MESTLPIKLKPADKGIAAVIGAIIIGVVGYAAYVILPYAIELAENTLIFMAEAGAIFLVIAFLVSNWSSLTHGWLNMARKIRRFVAREDPMGVLRNIQSRLTRRLDEIDEARIKADAAFKTQAKAQLNLTNKGKENEALARQANDDGAPQPKIAKFAAIANEALKAAENMQTDIDHFQYMLGKTTEARDFAENKLGETEARMEILAIQLEAAKAKKAAVSAFKRFFSLDGDAEIGGMAVEAIEQEGFEADAQIEEFLRSINPQIEEQKLRERANQSEALKRFNFKTEPKQIEAQAIDATIVAVNGNSIAQRASDIISTSDTVVAKSNRR